MLAGAVVIGSGGSVTANGAYQEIGKNTNASLTVEGSGRFSTNSTLNISDSGGGSCSLTIQDTAQVSVTDNQYNLGVDLNGAAGTLNLNGGTLTTLRMTTARTSSTSTAGCSRPRPTALLHERHTD